MAMGELLVAASIKFVFEKLATLASSELSNFARGFGRERRIRTLLTKWSKTLEEIEAVLVDADEKRVTERGIKIWLEDLQDMAYDVDDILDEFSTEALRPKSMITTKVRALIPTNIINSKIFWNVELCSACKRWVVVVMQGHLLKLGKDHPPHV
ncbi:unnamed protein product [Camellia sinensis]